MKKSRNILLVATLLASIASVAMPASTSAAPLLTATAKVSFTFDDGYSSALSDAAPTLAKYGYTGTDYVITGCVGMTTAPNTCHANTAGTYMTWAQINQLKAAGWEIASHTASHPYLASFDAADGQPSALTPAQVTQELTGASQTLTSQGFNPVDFASPYGDYTMPVLSQIAKYYGSHRGFADIGYNTFPYNDYLIYDQQVQGGVSVATVKSYIDAAKANNQWLVLTFHDIKPGATGSVNPDDYQYSASDLDQIAAYVKSLGLPVVNMADGPVKNVGNLLPNSSFDAAISSNIADTTVWSTDSPASIKQDTAGNGSYNGVASGPTNSVSFTGTTVNAELFSPRVAVDSTKRYVIKNFLNVSKMTVAAGHEMAFYVDEYDANGTFISTQYKKSEPSVFVENLNFEYVPTSATVKTARLQVVVTANSGAQAYLDNVQWFAEDGSTTGGLGAGTVGKAGDVNGDNAINALDLSIMLSNWNKTGTTRLQGDLSGDGAVNALDLSILLTNWNK